MKRVVRLTEGDLHRIVKESVKRVLREEDDIYKRCEQGYNSLTNDVKYKVSALYSAMDKLQSQGRFKEANECLSEIEKLSNENPWLIQYINSFQGKDDTNVKLGKKHGRGSQFFGRGMRFGNNV